MIHSTVDETEGIEGMTWTPIDNAVSSVKSVVNLLRTWINCYYRHPLTVKRGGGCNLTLALNGCVTIALHPTGLSAPLLCLFIKSRYGAEVTARCQ